MHDVDTAEARVGRAETGLEAQTLAQAEGPGLLGDEGVGALLEEEAVGPFRPDRPAQVPAGLAEGEGDGLAPLAADLEETVGGGEAGDAPADDDHSPRRHGPLASRTRSASIATNAGWSLTVAARWKATPQLAAISRASTSRS